MNLITIELSEEQYNQLQALANEKGIRPEELLSSEVAAWLDLQKGAFASAADYVLNKNAELYRRLA